MHPILSAYPHFVHAIGLLALAAWYAGLFPRAQAQPRFLPLTLYALCAFLMEAAHWGLVSVLVAPGGTPPELRAAIALAAAGCIGWAIWRALAADRALWPWAHRWLLIAHFTATFGGEFFDQRLASLWPEVPSPSAIAGALLLTAYIVVSLPLARRAGARLHWSMVVAVLLAVALGYFGVRNAVVSALMRTEGSVLERALNIAAALDFVEVDAYNEAPASLPPRLAETLARARAINPDLMSVSLVPARLATADPNPYPESVQRNMRYILSRNAEFALGDHSGVLGVAAAVRGIDRIAAVLLVQHDRSRRDFAVRDAAMTAHLSVLFLCLVVLVCIAGYQRVVRLVDRRSSLLDATATVSMRLYGGEDPVATARWLTSFLHERLQVVRADVWLVERREGRLGFVIGATSPNDAPRNEWIASHHLPDAWHIALQAGHSLDSSVPPTLPSELESSRAARRILAEPILVNAQPWGALVLFGRAGMHREIPELRNALRTLSASFSSALVRRERTNLLRAAEERFRLIIDTSIDGFWDIDFSTGGCYHSPRWWDMLGYRAGELPDDLKTTRALMHPEDLAPLDASAAEHLSPGVRPLQHQVRVRHRDGRWIWIEASAVEVRTTAGPAHRALGFDRDVTERRLANERLREALASAEQANRAKSDFLAAMSHELRTPLNTVIGLSSLLQRSSLTPRQAEWIEATQISAEQLLALINDLLDLSKIEAGRLELRRAPFELRATVERVVSLFAKDAGEKSLPLDCVVRAPLGPIWVEGDELRFRQVLTNLVANALKFTVQGRVWVGLHPGEGDLWHFAVHDTGPGIPEEKLGQLFQRFSQLEPTKATRVGTGLGLAISRELVQQMGGEIGVESTVGEGSTFRFTLPLAKCEGPARRTTDNPDFSGLNLVIWDPEPIEQAALECLFHGTGLELQSCRDDNRLLNDLVLRPECVAVLFPRSFAPEHRAIARRLREVQREGGRVRSVGLHAKADDAVNDPDFDSLMSSPPRQRSLFELFLGRKSDRPAAASRSLPPVHVEGILVAEDHPSNRLVMQAMLTSLNLQATFVEDGSLAIEAMRQRQFACALLDVGMPVLDGIGVAQWVKEKWDLPWPRPRLVAVTAFASHNDRSRFLEAGMDDVLAKPFTRDELHRVLAHFLPAGDKAAAAPAAPAAPAPAPAPVTVPIYAPAPEPEPVAPAEGGEAAVLEDVDWERLEALMETTNARRNAAIFRRIINNFRNQATQELAELAVIPDSDPAAAKRALHRFKGALASLALQAAAHQVTHAHDTGEFPPLKQRAVWLEVLRDTIDRSLAEIYTRYPWLDETGA
jgi:PAS domain S-box-containing protein